jgi:hypothetical protein
LCGASGRGQGGANQLELGTAKHRGALTTLVAEPVLGILQARPNHPVDDQPGAVFPATWLANADGSACFEDTQADLHGRLLLGNAGLVNGRNVKYEASFGGRGTAAHAFVVAAVVNGADLWDRAPAEVGVGGEGDVPVAGVVFLRDRAGGGDHLLSVLSGWAGAVGGVVIPPCDLAEAAGGLGAEGAGDLGEGVDVLVGFGVAVGDGEEPPARRGHLGFFGASALVELVEVSFKFADAASEGDVFDVKGDAEARAGGARGAWVVEEVEEVAAAAEREATAGTTDEGGRAVRVVALLAGWAAFGDFCAHVDPRRGQV